MIFFLFVLLFAIVFVGMPLAVARAMHESNKSTNLGFSAPSNVRRVPIDEDAA